MYPNQRRPSAADPSHHHRNVLAVHRRAVIDVDGELSITSGKLGGRHSHHQLFRIAAILGQVRDIDHPKRVSLRQTLDGRRAGGIALAIQNFAHHPHRLQSGQPRQIRRGLRMPGPDQNAPLARPHRKNVPGRLRSSGWVFGFARTRIVVARSVAEIPVVTPFRASTVTVKLHPRDWAFSSARTIRGQPELHSSILCHGDTDQTAALLDHEVDVRGGGLLGRHDQVRFILAIMAVSNDDQLPFTNGRNCTLYCGNITSSHNSS